MEHAGCCVDAGRNKNGKREKSKEASVIVQTRNNGDQKEGGNNRFSEKYLDAA